MYVVIIFVYLATLLQYHTRVNRKYFYVYSTQNPVPWYGLSCVILMSPHCYLWLVLIIEHIHSCVGYGIMLVQLSVSNVNRVLSFCLKTASKMFDSYFRECYHYVCSTSV